MCGSSWLHHSVSDDVAIAVVVTPIQAAGWHVGLIGCEIFAAVTKAPIHRGVRTNRRRDLAEAAFDGLPFNPIVAHSMSSWLGMEGLEGLGASLSATGLSSF